MQAEYPRLHLRRQQTDMCNVCFRIDTELADAGTTEERRKELLLQKETHLGINFVCNCFYNSVKSLKGKDYLFDNNISLSLDPFYELKKKSK